MPSELEQAFSERPDLLGRIIDHISRTTSSGLFDEIAIHINTLKRRGATPSDEHPNKKRKIDDTVASTRNGVSNSYARVMEERGVRAGAYYTVKEVSFSVPQRKKLTLELSAESPDHHGLSHSDKKGYTQTEVLRTGEIRAVNPTSEEVEFGVGWQEIVPEKQQRTHNFLIIPTGNDGFSHSAGIDSDQIVFTLPETISKSASFDSSRAPSDLDGPSSPDADNESYVNATIRHMNASLARYHKKVILPQEAEFASAVPQPHRKGEKAFHVKAFRGSKDGYLYFLPVGIVFGFKKPLLFIQFHRIDSISYTSVLQRTFNIVVATLDDNPNMEAEKGNVRKTEGIEFGMIDQTDFAGIDAWVKKHGLNDLSMAEQRKASRNNVIAGGRGNGNDTDGIGNEKINPPNHRAKGERYEPGELERAARQAEQELQDEEDEEEEDYDPGSEGESEGEGDSSEDGAGGDDEIERMTEEDPGSGLEV
ncbi:MAG: hypothetical protein M1821_007820 [Bathelium mastoideum]|nr:MAG: hypothetical protein M1821_007820 [Bathelium mastoideum]